MNTVSLLIAVAVFLSTAVYNRNIPGEF